MTMPAAPAAAPGPRRAAMSVVPDAIDARGNVTGSLASLDFRLDDVARAMYCVGRINYRRSRWSHALPHRHGPSTNPFVNVQLASLLKREWVSRLELVHAYCAPQSASSPHGSQLVLSEIVSMLDSSEKGSFAYFLGQAFTWMYCEDRLRPVQLLHKTRSNSHFLLTPGLAANQGPDLIGIDPGGVPVIAEAKGSVSFTMTSLRSKMVPAMINQLCAVHSVVPRLHSGRYLRRGVRCCHRVGCAAGFASPGTSWSAAKRSTPLQLFVLHLCCTDDGQGDAVDPEEFSPPETEVDGRLADELRFGSYYTLYQCVQADTPAWSRVQLEFGGRRVAAARTDDGQYTLGLLVGIADLVEGRLRDAGGDRVDLDGFADEASGIVQAAADAPLFADGTYFSADWPDWAD